MTQPEADDVGTLEVSVVADLRGFAANLRRRINQAAAAIKARIEARAETARARAEIIAAARQMSRTARAEIRVGADLNPARAAVTAFLSFLSRTAGFLKGSLLFGGIAAGISLLAAALTSATGSLIAFLAAAAPAWQGIALLPAALGSAIALFATFKVALAGVGDALKETFKAYSTLAVGGKLTAAEQEKLNATLKNLAPSAREFVMAIAELAPVFREIRLDVQQRFFEGLGAAFQKLANNQLPVVAYGLRNIADVLNKRIIEALDWIDDWAVTNILFHIFEDTARAVDGLGMALGPLLQIFLDITQAGMPFLAGFAQGFGEAAQRAAEFIRTAKETGQLQQFISQGLSVLGQLGVLLANIGSGLAAIFRAADAAASGGALENALAITQLFRDWANSEEGQAALISFFTALRDINTALGPVLKAVANAIGGALSPAIAQIVTVLAPFATLFVDQLADGIREMTPQLVGLAAAFGQLAVAVVPILTGLLTGGVIDGLTSLLAGLALGLAALAPAAEPVGRALGAIALAVAPLLELLGAFLANTLILLAGSIEVLVKQVTPLIGIFSAAFTDVLNSLLPVLQELVANGLQAAAGAAVALAEAFIPLIPVITEISRQVVDKLLQYLPQIQEVVATKLMPALLELAVGLSEILLEALIELAPHIPHLVEAALQLFFAFVQLMAAIGPKLVPMILQLAKTGFQLWKAMVPLLPVVLDLMLLFAQFMVTAAPVIGLFLQLATMVLEVALETGVLQMVISSIAITVQLFSSILRGLIGWMRDVHGWFVSLAATIGSAVKDGFEKAKGFVSDIIDEFKKLPDRLRNIGVEMINGLIGGIKSMGDKVGQTISGVAKSGIQAATKALGISSPSKVFMQIGREVADGFTLGIERGRNSVAVAAEKLADATAGSITVRAGDLASRGLNVEHLEVKAYSDRFSLRDVQDELALHAVF